LRNAQSAQLKQKRKGVHDGECAQKEYANPAVSISPQHLSGKLNNPHLVNYRTFLKSTILSVALGPLSGSEMVKNFSAM